MSKYIPADKLIAEIERLKGLLIHGACAAQIEMETNCKDEAYNEVLSFITSLQQDKDVLELCSQVWWAERGWIMIPPNVTLKGIESLLERVRHKIKWNEENGIKEQEQPEVDLDSALTEFMSRYAFENGGEYLSAIDIARHFYELGKARKESTKKMME